MSVFDYDKNRDNRKPFHASGMAENAARRATDDNQDKYAKQDNTPSGSNGEHYSLNDDRRVKVLSPGALVAKRFFRNRLAVVGLSILIFMFVFSFIGGLLSPYGEDEFFYRDDQINKEFAVVTENSDFRYMAKDSALFGSPVQAQTMLAIQKSSETFSYGGNSYTLTPEGTDFYSVSSGGKVVGIAYKDVVSSSTEGQALSFEFVYTALKSYAALEQELRVLLLPHDPNDGKNVILEIRPGVGGEESALFAHSLFRMYSLYAAARGWTVELLNYSETELGGIKEADFMICGAGAYSRLKFESGVHRAHRVPKTESQGRIQTSTATVAVLPEAEEIDVQINQSDLRIDTYCASGPGGQCVNTTYSAVRITHLPTGTVVECQDERSQYKNKDRAMKILRSKLYEAQQEKQNAAIAAQRKSQVGTGDRSGKIRTYNFPQNRVTDHRLTGDAKNFNIAAIINGDLDPLIDALTLANQAQRLQEGTEKGE